MVTLRANHSDIRDGTFVRDSQAQRGCRSAARHGRKRKVERSLPSDPMERLLKLPRLADLRQRVLAKATGRVGAVSVVG